MFIYFYVFILFYLDTTNNVLIYIIVHMHLFVDLNKKKITTDTNKYMWHDMFFIPTICKVRCLIQQNL